MLLLSSSADLYECTRCGRRWAVNHELGIMRSWKRAEPFYRQHGLGSGVPLPKRYRLR